MALDNLRHIMLPQGSLLIAAQSSTMVD